MMKKRLLAAVVCLSMLLGSAAGCSSGGGDSGSTAPAGGAASSSQSKGKEGKDLTFVIVPKCVHAWFDEVNKGAVAQANKLTEELGVKVSIDYRAPNTADVAEQNTVLQQAAATKPDGIALDPCDYKGSKAVIEEIQAQGIPVVLFDSPAPEGSNLTSVGNDFAEQATLAADKLAETIGKKGKVAVMQGLPTAPNHAERYQAHLDALKKYPDIQVIDGGIDNDNIETAQSQAAAVLAANPDLTGYLCCDASGPIGISAAIKEAGKVGKVKIVGMDNLIDILNYIKDGTMTATSSTMPQMQGSMAVLMMWQKHLGIDIPKTVDTGIAFIDSSNVDKWIEIVKK
ncbi:Peripla_BP_4 domain-containing protein [Ruminococcaceae bacterium BL-6]|jgi:ribose transport system substrate-binding protein|nr:Peripla_BP_4 domain-containing protein [Ruminococcaceae bacterium BL-6]